MNKLVSYYRLIELAERMRQDGLGCPRCAAVSREHSLVDNSNDPHLICSGCGVSFTQEDLLVEPAFELEDDHVVLYRPVGPQELAKVEASGWTEFPSRLHWQPIFYPVLNRRYAQYIAGKWNVEESRAGFVTRFRVHADVARRYPVQVVGAAWCQELWIPAEELDSFNSAIVGKIEVVGSFGTEGDG